MCSPPLYASLATTYYKPIISDGKSSTYSPNLDTPATFTSANEHAESYEHFRLGVNHNYFNDTSICNLTRNQNCLIHYSRLFGGDSVKAGLLLYSTEVLSLQNYPLCLLYRQGKPDVQLSTKTTTYCCITSYWSVYKFINLRETCPVFPPLNKTLVMHI